MTRFINDQSKLVFLWESGTYGFTSGNGVWPGLVQEVALNESQNTIQTRYLGQGNRNVGTFQDGPLDFEGTFTLFPLDWRFLGLAIGSVGVTNTALNFQNSISEVNNGQRASAFTSGYFNPWPSFTIEESRTGNVANKNFVRVFRGAVVNTLNMEINQGEPIKMEIGVIAQTGSFASGATTAVTAGSNRPYLWSDSKFSVDSSVQEPVKNFVFDMNNNFEMPHYLNGSRIMQVPYNLNRDYLLTVTQDLDANVVGSLYNTYFQGGSLFNATLDVDYSSAVVGSHRLTMTFSGCTITEMESPITVGGISETTYKIVPGSVSAIAHDRYSYNPF